MDENGVQIDDLCAVAMKDLPTLQSPHNVHFTKDGYKALAQSAADSILAALGK
jgi:hypothetical protein